MLAPRIASKFKTMCKNFLQAERVVFRPYCEDDLDLIFEWFNNPVVTYYMFTGQRPQTKAALREFLEKDIQSEKNVLFMVVDKESKQTIGVVGLYDIHPTAHKAEMRIIIGNKDFWGKGYGTEVTELITYYGFDRLNLNKIYLGFTEENKRAAGAYEKAGYTREGVLKEDIYRNSQYYDSVRMAILRKDYYEKYYNNYKNRFAVLHEEN